MFIYRTEDEKLGSMGDDDAGRNSRKTTGFISGQRKSGREKGWNGGIGEHNLWRKEEKTEQLQERKAGAEL